MFDIGFWELLVIAVVLLLVMGPERLPEVARQAAFLVRKIRQGVFRLRSEMQSEMDNSPFSDLQKARQEVTDFKNDIKQFGRELVDSTEEFEMKQASVGAKADDDSANPQAEPEIAITKPVKHSHGKTEASDTVEQGGGATKKSRDGTLPPST